MKKNIFLESPEVLTKELLSFVDGWGRGGDDLDRWLKKAQKNRAFFESLALRDGLAVDEQIQARMPQTRTRVRQFVSFMAKKKLAFEAVVSAGGEQDPIQVARLARAVCDEVVREQRMQEKAEIIAEKMLVEGLCFASCLWRDDKGKILFFDQSLGTSAYEGNLSIEVHDVSDVFWPWRRASWDQVPWVVLRTTQPRADLCAQFPDLIEQIDRLPGCGVGREREALNDLVEIFYFFSRPSVSLPFGRHTIFGRHHVVFFDSPAANPYEDLPLTPFLMEPIAGTTLGYPLLNNLMPIQQLLDATLSAVATTSQAAATPAIMVPKGSDLSVSDLQNFNLVTYSPLSVEGGGRPESLQLVHTPPELLRVSQMLDQMLGESSLITETLRGQPSPAVTSGVMAATLSSNALEFIHIATQRLLMGLEFLMTMAVRLYKLFASQERLVEVVGPQNEVLTQQFRGADLSQLKRVKIQQTNPLLGTTAGRLSLSEGIMQLLQAGREDLVQKYLLVLEGGTPAEVYQNELSTETAVQLEIDALLRGEEPVPLITDDHPQFIRAYQQLLYNPQVRSSGVLVPLILKALERRIELEAQLSPELKSILRGDPAPVRMPSRLPSERVENQ